MTEQDRCRQALDLADRVGHALAATQRHLAATGRLNGHAADAVITETKDKKKPAGGGMDDMDMDY
ncbi:MAG: hypothetical protein AAF586_01865 [Planctomycetota bacterium]